MASIANELIKAAKKGDVEMVARCLALGADLEARDSDEYTPLLVACAQGKTAVVERLLDAGANVYVKDSHRSTPLNVAAERGFVGIVELLLRAGASVDDADNDGDSPLMCAAAQGHDAVVERLLQAGANANFLNKNGSTALIAATEEKQRNARVVELLLEAGADVDHADEDKCTPLILATLFNHTRSVELLIDAGANINFTNVWGNHALHLAAEYGRDHTLSLLLEAGADHAVVNNKKKTALFLAGECKKAHAAEVLRSLQGSSLAFFAAVKSGDVATVRTLVDRYAAARGFRARTPLHIAARHGALDVLKLLVFRGGATVDDRDEAGWTPLHFACKNGSTTVGKLLVAQGASMAVKEENGLVPVDIAALHGHLDVVRELNTTGTSLTNVSFDGRTILHRAAASKNADLLMYLLDEGVVPVDATDENGWTALHHAVRSGDAASVATLLEHGAMTEIKTSTANQETPLLSAARLGFVDKVARLVAHQGVDLESRDALDRTPLLAAISMGHVRVAAKLIQAGANVHAQDAKGNAALLLATYRNDTEAVYLLLQHHARTDQANAAGKTPRSSVVPGEIQSVLQLYYDSQLYHDRSLAMLSGSPTLSELKDLVPLITSVYDLRLLLSLVSMGGPALGSPHERSALVKAAFSHVVTTKLVFDDSACVFFKLALDHCAETKLLPRSDIILLDRQAEKVNTESADWVVDLKKQVYSNSSRLDAHDACLRAVVTGLNEVHTMVQENRAAIKMVATRVNSLQQQVALGRKLVAQLVDHANCQSGQMAHFQERLTECERKVENVSTRFESFHSAFAKQQEDQEKNEKAKKMCGIVTTVVGLFVPAVKEIADAIIDYANPVEIVKLVYGESDVAGFVAETTPHDLPPAVERQLAKLAIPKEEFETLLREEIALQHPEILEECRQRQLVVSVDAGRGDTARALVPSLDAEEAALIEVLGQLRLAAEGMQTPRTSSVAPNRPVMALPPVNNQNVTWEEPTNTSSPVEKPPQPRPQETKAATETGRAEVGAVVFEDNLDAFPFHAAVHASGGDCAAFVGHIDAVGGSDNSDATTPMAMAIRSDAAGATTTETTQTTLCAAEYAYCLGYDDVGDFLASQMDDQSSVVAFKSRPRVVGVELNESVDDFAYVSVVDQCQGDVDECELLVELLNDEGHDPLARIQATVEREAAISTTPVTWSAVEYASHLGYVEIVKVLVKDHCKRLPAKAKVQLLKDARERAVHLAQAAP